MNKETSQVVRFSRYTRLGSWIAIVSISTIGFVEIFKRVPSLNERVLWGVAGLEVIGLLLLIDHFERYFRKETPDEIMRFNRNPHFWGAALIVIGVLVYFCCPRITVVAQTSPPVKQVERTVEPVIEVPAPEPVIFPEVMVNGVIVNGASSTATINGRVVELGGRVQGATLVQVSETTITLELNGQRKEYGLGLAGKN